jgi:shikimate kinase/3-dehydroquinate synthase
MGSGKSTAARVVAARAGLEAWDLDRVVEQRTGKKVSALFAEQGEQAFRRLERDALHDLLAKHGDGVFALGGGTVTDRELRRELLRHGVLITLRADVAELARRVGGGDGDGRPLLAGQNVGDKLRALLAERAEAYAECHRELDTNGRDAQAVAEAVLEIAADPPLLVPLGTRSYRVEVGAGARSRLPARAAEITASGRALVVSDDVVAPLWADTMIAALRAQRGDVASVAIPAGEQHKTLSTVERIWGAALDAAIDRGGMFIGIGGGVVGDLSGFAAATLLRGIPIGHVPTTLLAMVDSAIGGKTGFDTRHGKNLIGSFHQPSFVLCDTDTLATLPQAERRAGLAEVVKSAWIDGELAVRQLELDAPGLAAGEPNAIVRAIRMSAALKAKIVTEDERESGSRALLNLGHTVGHAIEASLGYQGMRHGEAVSLGMVAAFRLGVRLQITPRADLERLETLLSALSLHVDVSAYLQPKVLSFINADKKRRSANIAFVLPHAPGRVALELVPLAELPGLLMA